MHVKDALRSRRSIRAFMPTPVSDKIIIDLLDSARWAPSGSNTQPWKVAVVKNQQKDQLQQKLEDAHQQQKPMTPDYTYYPTQWTEPYSGRRKSCGIQLYQSLGISREDKQRRQQQWIANYHSFDAPAVLLFFMDKKMEAGSYLDYGMFLQSFMLAATEQGLASCAQAALCDYSDIIRDHLGYDKDQVFLCGIALGYEDSDAAVNGYRTPRDSASHFTEFFD